MRLKEKGYIPTDSKTHTIKSGMISYKAGRYYVSVLVEEQEKSQPELNDFGIGIDLGIKDFAITSNGISYKNINKTSTVKKLEKQLKREQRCLSRKYEGLKKRSNNIKKEKATRQNIQKQQLKVQKLHQRIENIRTDYINKGINEFRTKLEAKCKENGIELRIADRWFPSSKLCHECGCIKNELKLSDREYVCKCGHHADRDLNAALNLRDAETYKVA